MMQQVIDEAAGMAARQDSFAGGPVAPVVTQHGFLMLLFSTVEFIWGGQRQTKRVLETLSNHQPRNKFAARCDGAEPLVIKVIRHPVNSDFVECLLRDAKFGRCQLAQTDVKTVGADVSGAVRSRELTKISNCDVVVPQAALRAMEDGEVLYGCGVPILEASIGQAARLNLPAAANSGQRIRRGPAALLQPVESE